MILMHHKTHAFVRQIMMPYTTKGKKSYFKKVQMKRLISMLDDIFQHEGMADLSSIGKRQIIGYWRRTEAETDKTRREKYSILKKYFSLYNPNIRVPEPKKRVVDTTLGS